MVFFANHLAEIGVQIYEFPL